MTWAAVGSPIFAASSSAFSLTPGGVGDLILLEVNNKSNPTVTASSLSSSNVTWAQMGTALLGSANSQTAVIFAGTVTSTSTATVTVTWSGTTPGSYQVNGQEFSSTAGSWALDAQGSIDGAGTSTWASLTPAAAGELYFGYAYDNVGAVAGSTTGFVYVVDANANGLAYNVNCGAGATAPVWGDSTFLLGKMILVKETSAAGPKWVPQRYGQAAPPSMAPWEQRPYRSVPGAADTAANPLPSPLDVAWQADGRYSHLYDDTAARDRRAYFTQRLYQSDPLLLTTAELENELLGGGDYSRQFLAATHYDRREVPQQPARLADPLLIGTAELENELLGSMDDLARHRAWYADRREVPQQRQYYLPPPPFLLENELLGGAQTQPHYVTAAYYDRREVPQQRAYLSDPSTYPSGAVTDPLTVAWGDGGPYWHLYNRAGDIADRRAYFTQRLYQSDPLLLLSALLENELLGGAQTGTYYRVPATHAPRWWMPQQPPRLADPLLIGTAELENELLGSADTARHWLAACYADRREVPQQRPYISDPSTYPSGAVTDPLTVAWGAGGTYWHLYNRAGDIADRRLVPQQRAYVSPPGMLASALLENELLGGGDDLARHRAWYDSRREYPAQRPGTSLPDIPADSLILGDDRARHLLAAGYWPRGWAWFQRQFFPVPVPPPPVTYGTARQGQMTIPAAAAGDSGLTAARAQSGQMTIPRAEGGQYP